MGKILAALALLLVVGVVGNAVDAGKPHSSEKYRSVFDKTSALATRKHWGLVEDERSPPAKCGLKHVCSFDGTTVEKCVLQLTGWDQKQCRLRQSVDYPCSMETKGKQCLRSRYTGSKGDYHVLRVSYGQPQAEAECLVSKFFHCPTQGCAVDTVNCYSVLPQKPVVPKPPAKKCGVEHDCHFAGAKLQKCDLKLTGWDRTCNLQLSVDYPCSISTGGKTCLRSRYTRFGRFYRVLRVSYGQPSAEAECNLRAFFRCTGDCTLKTTGCKTV